MMHTIWFYLGLTSPNRSPYLAYSGIVPNIRDFIEIPLLATLFFWHHNCHHHGCYRIRTYPDGHGWKWCRRHHPDLDGEHPTVEAVMERRNS